MRFVVPLLALSLLSCHESGTWIDDPHNFERAWGLPPPSGVRVLHSTYYRSAHFTREEIYYFEFAPSPSLAESFASSNRLSAQPTTAITPYTFANPRPAWFAPGSLEEYEIWSAGRDPAVVIMRNKTTAHTFVYACQL